MRPDLLSSKRKLTDVDRVHEHLERLSRERNEAQAEVERLRHGLELIVRESEQFPDEDGIGAGAMARNILNG